VAIPKSAKKSKKRIVGHAPRLRTHQQVRDFARLAAVAENAAGVVFGVVVTASVGPADVYLGLAWTCADHWQGNWRALLALGHAKANPGVSALVASKHIVGHVYSRSAEDSIVSQSPV
jgi:hypothetical protein